MKIKSPYVSYCRASQVTQLVKNPLQCRRPGFNHWVGRILWRRKQLPTPVFWPGEFHGLYIPWVTNSPTRLRNFHFSLGNQETICPMAQPEKKENIFELLNSDTLMIDVIEPKPVSLKVRIKKIIFLVNIEKFTGEWSICLKCEMCHHEDCIWTPGKSSYSLIGGRWKW